MPPEAATLEDPDTLVVLDNDADTPDAALDGAEGEGEGDPQPNPEAERVAALMGWKPDFKGPGKKSAEEFLVEFPEALRNANKKSRALEDKLARVVGQIAQFEATQRKTISAQHERALAEAVESNDLDAAKRILAEAKEMEKVSDDGPLEAFKARNDWFERDVEATAYALSLDTMYARQTGGKIIDQEGHMKRIEDGVRKKFPELFGEPAEVREEAKPRPRAPLVAGGNRTASRRDSAELTVATMTPQQRQAAKEFGVPDESYVRSWNEQQRKNRQ
jgi:hypothetical protein